MDSYSPFGRALKEHGRTQHGIAAELSERLGRTIFQQQVSLWALGKGQPAADVAVEIAALLGLSVAHLAFHADAECQTSDPADDGVGRREAA